MLRKIMSLGAISFLAFGSDSSQLSRKIKVSVADSSVQKTILDMAIPVRNIQNIVLDYLTWEIHDERSFSPIELKYHTMDDVRNLNQTNSKILSAHSPCTRYVVFFNNAADQSFNIFDADKILVGINVIREKIRYCNVTGLEFSKCSNFLFINLESWHRSPGPRGFSYPILNRSVLILMNQAKEIELGRKLICESQISFGM